MSNKKAITLRLNDKDAQSLELLKSHLREKITTKAITHAMRNYKNQSVYLRKLEDEKEMLENIIKDRKYLNDKFVSCLHEMMKIKEHDR